MKLFILLIVILWPHIGISQETADLTVVAEGIRSNEGVIYMELSDETGQAWSSVKVVIKEKQAQWTFTEIPRGKWAVRLFHDENSNGKMDTNFLGIPREGYGFSNNVRGRFGPPPLEQRLFEFQSDSTISINLIY